MQFILDQIKIFRSKSELRKPSENSLFLLFPSVLLSHWQQVWTLCEALWGRLGDQDLEPVVGGGYREQRARRHSFSRWLSESAAQCIQEEVYQCKTQSHVDAIFSYLTGHCISEACRLAQKNGAVKEEKNPSSSSHCVLGLV